MQNMPIGIFRGDDTDAFGYQTIVGTIKTDLDLTGCRAVFRYLGFSMEFDPIPEDKKLTIVIPADETKKFPPGLGYASLRVYDSEGKLKTFSNRIMVFVATKTPMFGSDEFEVDFNVRASLEPLKFFVGPNPDDFDEYRGYVEKVIDRASAAKYGLAILLDAIDSDLGAEDGVAATPVAVKAAYAAIIEKLTDDYYTSEQTDEAIDRVAAYYITYDAAGNPFPTYAALANAQIVYSGGKVRVPTRNDYCVVLADETHQGAEYRYIYAVAEGQTTRIWQPQFPVEGVMTVDQSVTRNSQNPVSGGGVWSAIWGALASLPSGFSSLYDWVVAQLAGKASTADATLTDRGFTEWVCNPAVVLYGNPSSPTEIAVAVYKPDGQDVWALSYLGHAAQHSTTYFASQPYDSAATSLTFTISGSFGFITRTVTATREAIQGYTLGSQTDKPLASEAEAEALRTGKQDALSDAQLANIAAVSDALAFDATHSYAAGDPVVYNGTLYTFTAAHTGAWTGSDVSAVDIIARLAGKLDKSGGIVTGDLEVDYAAYGFTVKDSSGNYLQIRHGTVAGDFWYINYFVANVGSGELRLPYGNIIPANIYSLANQFNPSTAYAPNSLCIDYEHGVLYRCVNPNGHTGAWVAADFAVATVEDVLAALRTGKVDVSAVPYSLGTPIVINSASSEVVDGETVYYGAATLTNRTSNIVQVPVGTPLGSPLDELRITFPAATSGKVRDFGLRVEIGTGSAALAAPALVPIAPTGETIKIENNAAEIPALADGTATAKGVTLLYFSETAPGVFVVKGEQVEEVA